MTKAPAVARPDGGDRRRRYRRLGKSSPAPRWPASGIATFPPVTGVAADAMYFCGLGPIAEVKRCQYARHGAGLLTPEAETETRFTAADTSSGGRSSRTATCGPRGSARCIRPLTAACRGGLRGARQHTDRHRSARAQDGHGCCACRRRRHQRGIRSRSQAV
jgi:hypothetical protein